MNNIKQEIEKINIPNDLHERSKMGVKKAKLEQPKRRYKNPLVAAAIISVLGCGFYVSSPGQAMFEGLFQVSKFKKRANVEEMSFGYSVENVPFYGEKAFNSLNEMEETFNVLIPFPEQLLGVEENDELELVEYKAQTDENGNFFALFYNLSAPERYYSVVATNHEDAIVKFSAETADGTAIEKDIEINGVKAKLLGTKEIDGYAIYMEKENWKLIIMSTDRANSLEGQSDVKEEELISIAQSIKW